MGRHGLPKDTKMFLQSTSRRKRKILRELWRQMMIIKDLEPSEGRDQIRHY